MGILTEQRSVGWDYGKDEDIRKRKLRGWVIAVLFSGAVLSLIAGAVISIVNWSSYMAHTTCDKFETNSHIQTEYAKYGFWGWDCYALLPDGTKLPIDKLYVNKGN